MHMFSSYNRKEDGDINKPYQPGPHEYKKAEWPHEDWKVKKIKKNPRVTAFGEWVKIVQEPHTCHLPDVVASDIGIGSIWQCHKCKAQWKYMGSKLKAEFSKIEDDKDTAYCVYCKERVAMENRTVKVSDSGRKMAHGTCAKCGTKVNRILGKDS